MKGRFDLRPVQEIVKLIRHGNFCIVHSHSPRAALLCNFAARVTGALHIYHLHSVTSADSTHGLRNRVNTRVERASLAGAPAIIAVSESLREHAIAGGLRPPRLHVVHNGVQTPGDLAQRATPTNTWTLGMVARFRPRKGLEILLEALAELRNRGYRLRLNAIGAFDTPEYEASIHTLETRLNLQDMIDWRGFRSDVYAEMRELDIFVLPSLFGEGLPMAVLEAMAVGVPVISTRVEGVPEAVRHGVDGLVCKPGDSHDLAGAVEGMITGQVNWQDTRSNAHARQKEFFSDVSMSRGVSGVYRQVLSNART